MVRHRDYARRAPTLLDIPLGYPPKMAISIFTSNRRRVTGHMYSYLIFRNDVGVIFLTITISHMCTQDLKDMQKCVVFLFSFMCMG